MTGRSAVGRLRLMGATFAALLFVPMLASASSTPTLVDSPPLERARCPLETYHDAAVAVATGPVKQELKIWHEAMAPFMWTEAIHYTMDREIMETWGWKWNVTTCTFYDPKTTPTCFGQPVTNTWTAGADVIKGTAGNDVLYGGGGNDKIEGKGGNDRICGGDGRDVLIGGAGNDLIDGGTGTDTVKFKTATTGVIVSLAAGTATGQGSDVIQTVERVVGSNYNDTLTGDDRGNRLDGQSGNDRLNGRGGNDQLVGGAGTDTLYGGSGTDRCYSGETYKSCE